MNNFIKIIPARAGVIVLLITTDCFLKAWLIVMNLFIKISRKLSVLSFSFMLWTDNVQLKWLYTPVFQTETAQQP